MGTFNVTSNGQVVENLTIVSDTDGIIALTFDNVIIRNCRIYHGAGDGILAGNCSNLTIENCRIICTAAPPVGINPGYYNNITLGNVVTGLISNVYLQDGSCGIFTDFCTGIVANFIEGRNFRGPYPRGQLCQFSDGSNCTLSNFSVVNDLNVAWTEDCVNVFNSTNCLIENGLVDGNNSPTGQAVIFDAASSGSANNIDAVNWSNGAFATVTANVTFTNCRAGYSYRPCTQGRGEPSSNSLAFGSFSGATGTVFASCTYFKLINPSNYLFDKDTCLSYDITPFPFVPRNPIQAVTPFMSFVISHPFVSAIADDPVSIAAGEATPSDWNANHTFTGTVPLANMTIAGGDTQVQFNDANILGASSNFTYNKVSGALTLSSGAQTALNVNGTGGFGGILNLDDGGTNYGFVYANPGGMGIFSIGAIPYYVGANGAVIIQMLGAGSSAGDHIQIANSTGGLPYINTDGTSTDINFGIFCKGAGKIFLGNYVNVSNATGVTVLGGATPVLSTTNTVTSGAGALLGTLTNSPKTGDPTTWIPFNDAGVTRYIPAW